MAQIPSILACLTACVAPAFAGDPPATVTSTTAEPAATAKAPTEEQGPNGGRLHFSFGLDITNAYFFRGIRQEDEGVLFQPSASLAIDLYKSDAVTLQGNLGTWNSLHSKATGASTNDDLVKRWYEEDISAGLTAVCGKFTFGGTYIWETSPNHAFETVEELDLSMAYDDSELLGAYKLSPSVLLGFETGSAKADTFGPAGAYLQLGVSPGFDVQLDRDTPVSISFPITVGLSLSNYFQDSTGNNDAFGFASVGVKAAMPLPVSKDLGKWTLSVAASELFLGNACATFNNNHDTEFVATASLGVSY